MVHVSRHSRSLAPRQPQGPKPIHTYVDGSLYFDSDTDFDSVVQEYGLTRQRKDEDGHYVWKNPSTGLTLVTEADPYTGEGADQDDLIGFLGNVGLAGPSALVNSLLATLKSKHVDELPEIVPRDDTLTQHQSGRPVKQISLTNDILPQHLSEEKRVEREQAFEQDLQDEGT